MPWVWVGASVFSDDVLHFPHISLSWGPLCIFCSPLRYVGCIMFVSQDEVPAPPRSSSFPERPPPNSSSRTYPTTRGYLTFRPISVSSPSFYLGIGLGFPTILFSLCKAICERYIIQPKQAAEFSPNSHVCASPLLFLILANCRLNFLGGDSVSEQENNIACANLHGMFSHFHFQFQTQLRCKAGLDAQQLKWLLWSFGPGFSSHFFVRKIEKYLSPIRFQTIVHVST